VAPETAQTLASTSAPLDWRSVLIAVWAAGALTSLGLWLQRRRRFLRSIQPLTPSGIPADWPVYLSPSATVPFACGVLRPFIVLPVGLPTRLSAEELRVVVVHESLHLRHHDNLIANLSMLLRSSLWFHPLIWWLDHRLVVERERARDEEAVSLLGRESYVDGLLKACRVGIGFPDASAACMISGNLQKRIDLLMKSEITIQSQFTLRTWAILAAVAATAASIVLVPTPAGAQDQRRTNRSSGFVRVPPPHEKWLDEDVVYIVTFQERAAFRNLKTEAEREHFIEQFWLIRDPTPGTPENEMKVEHYRRIAYANQRFSTRTTPGWRTSRGKFYIQMGPPDELEDHPLRQIQLWRYWVLPDVTLQFDLKDPKQ
jgi:GWxTD domain-containing protein